MKKKRSCYFLVAAVFALTLFFPSRAVFGNELAMEMAETNYERAIEEYNIDVACSDDVSLVNEIQVEEECNIETAYDFVKVVSEQDVKDCDTEKEEEYQPKEEEGPVDMHEYLVLILRITFPERYTTAPQTLVFIVYEDGIEVRREDVTLRGGETGTAFVEFVFFYLGLMSEHVPGWFLDEVGEITWRVELPPNVTTQNPTAGRLDTASLPVGEVDGWNYYIIALELSYSPETPTETPTETPGTPETPAAPQTEDSRIPWEMFSLLLAIGFGLTGISKKVAKNGRE